jgi:DeoR family transcriptional regulator, aga operon transcriptional repressor
MVDAAPRKSPRLLVEERRRRILELLDERERATVEGLADHFDVSTVTIRGDLDELAERGTLVRSHGGAIKRLAHGDASLSVKERLNHREKVRIAREATRRIGDGETIILDSGTTTAEIGKQLKALNLRALTVITNGLNIAMQLAGLPHVRVIMIGGLLRQMSYSTVGPQAEQMLSGLTAHHLFLGVDGLDPEIGLTTPDVHEAQLNALMIRVSRQVTVVADASKFAQRSLSVIAGFSDIDRLITDHRADPQLVSALRAQDIDVTIV